MGNRWNPGFSSYCSKAARKGRDIAQRAFEITRQEQALGAGSNYQTITARRDEAAAESALVAALTSYRKAKVELDRAVGTTLQANDVSIKSAKMGIAPGSP